MKKVFFTIIILLIGLVLLILFRSCGKESEQDKSYVFPISCRISLLPGTEDEPSLVTLRLFNHTARQTKNDYSKMKPVVVNIPPDIWQEKVAFVKVNKQTDNEADISSSFIFLKGPQSKKLFFGPYIVYSVYYEIPLSNNISCEDIIQAQVKIDSFIIHSNTFLLPETPKTKEEAIYRRIMIAHRLGEYDELLTLANEMIEIRPGHADGYFFKGLAFEGKQLYKEALDTYQKSLKLVPIPEKGQFTEPPDLLYSHIREVKKKLEEGL